MTNPRPDLPTDRSECRATASAPVNHYIANDTFGHVCRREPGHGEVHRCVCGREWRDSDKASWERGAA